jgi:hypothetical protein
MKDSLRKVAVVCEKKDSLCLVIQASDVKEWVNIREVVADRRASFGIVKSRDDRLWLVKKKKKGFRFPGENLAFDENVVGFGIDTRPWFRHDHPIDRDKTRGDELLRFSPGSDPPVGEDFVKSCLVVISVPVLCLERRAFLSYRAVCVPIF